MNNLVYIFGASGAIGRQLAIKYLQAKCSVIAQVYKNSEFLQDVQNKYDNLQIVKLDLNNQEEVQNFFHEYRQDCQKEICIHTAAIAKSQVLAKLTEQDWTEVLHLNLTSVFFVAKSFARQKPRPKEGSHLVLFSSLAGIVGSMGKANYAASKGAIIGMSKSLAKEWARRGICVNTVIPGWVDSNLSLETGYEVKEKVMQDNLLHKESDPKQIANFVYTLTEMNQVSGQVFNLDSRVY